MLNIPLNAPAVTLTRRRALDCLASETRMAKRSPAMRGYMAAVGDEVLDGLFAEYAGVLARMRERVDELLTKETSEWRQRA